MLVFVNVDACTITVYYLDDTAIGVATAGRKLGRAYQNTEGELKVEIIITLT